MINKSPFIAAKPTASRKKLNIFEWQKNTTYVIEKLLHSPVVVMDVVGVVVFRVFDVFENYEIISVFLPQKFVNLLALRIETLLV